MPNNLKMKNKILVINGPNLDILGKREIDIYGNISLDEINLKMQKLSDDSSFDIEFYQSNIEGELIDKINTMDTSYKALIINPAAYTHTSLALFDSLNNLDILKIEVHISNIYKREEFRKKSLTAGACDSVLSGFGVSGYFLALEFIIGKK